MSEAKMNAATAIAINQFTMAAVPAAITTAMEIVKLGPGPLKDKAPEFIANLVADLATKIIRRMAHL
jgi:hypothetical protein